MSRRVLLSRLFFGPWIASNFTSPRMLRLAPVGLITLTSARFYKKHLFPLLKEMRVRQKKVGKFLPQRNALVEWDYSRELNAFCRRFSLEVDCSSASESLSQLQRAFCSAEYVQAESRRRSDLGLPDSGMPLEANVQLASTGLKKLRGILDAQLRESYPLLPRQGINSLCDYLCSTEKLGDVARQMGIGPLVLREGDGLSETSIDLLRDALLSLVTLVRDPESMSRRFILVQLAGQHVFDLWNPPDPASLLETILEANLQQATNTPLSSASTNDKTSRCPPYTSLTLATKGSTVDSSTSPLFEARIIGEAGRNTLEALFFVGIYDSNRRLLGKAGGASQAEAVDAAIRDALRRIFQVSRANRSPFEKMAIAQFDKVHQQPSLLPA